MVRDVTVIVVGGVTVIVVGGVTVNPGRRRDRDRGWDRESWTRT